MPVDVKIVFSVTFTSDTVGLYTVDHPINVYPLFVNPVGSVPIAVSNTTSFFKYDPLTVKPSVDVNVPPFGLNVTAYVFAVYVQEYVVSSLWLVAIADIFHVPV